MDQMNSILSKLYDNERIACCVAVGSPPVQCVAGKEVCLGSCVVCQCVSVCTCLGGRGRSSCGSTGPPTDYTPVSFFLVSLPCGLYLAANSPTRNVQLSHNDLLNTYTQQLPRRGSHRRRYAGPTQPS